MILVVSATGLVADEICRRVAKRGEKVRGGIRLTPVGEYAHNVLEHAANA
jgi:hypothetical protein